MGGNKQNHNKGPQGQYKNNQQQGHQGQYTNNQQQGSQGQYKNNQQQGQRRGPLICYGCNQEGHSKKDCLINPFPPQQGQGNGYQGRQDQGNYNQGQQGPFMGQGY